MWSSFKTSRFLYTYKTVSANITAHLIPLQSTWTISRLQRDIGITHALTPQLTRLYTIQGKGSGMALFLGDI
ncbi:MAG TPA: hypothetical protein DEA71_10370 [Nitrospira sp.]|nr:hypothetical protein [Nitrospira sp.]